MNNTAEQKTPTDGCSWYEHRFNVVPFPGTHDPSQFVDSLDEARTIKQAMLDRGNTEVRIYDTIDGEFHN